MRGRIKSLGVSAIALGALVLSAEIHAAAITWSGSSLAGDGTDDISDLGTPVEAHNTGSGAAAITAGGVLFDDAETNPLGAVFATANPTSMTGESNFDDILQTASFALTDVTITIDSLIGGMGYLVQFFVADSRTCCSGRTVTVDDLSGNTLTSGGIGSGYAFTGRFTADGTTQDVKFSGVAPGFTSVPYLNAWQLRQVPEPVTLSLIGLGLAGIGYQRRKQIKAA